MQEILAGLGADVTLLGFSDTFVPVDTEAVRPEDTEAIHRWALEYGLDSVVSSDGDSDRPLISNDKGELLRGDVAGILCAAFLGADAVALPVSCNTAVEKCGLFKSVYRTKIGSPYVIEGMLQALQEGMKKVVGYEANGGFLLGSDFERYGKAIKALPTRDAMMPVIAVLLLSREKNKGIGDLAAGLPQRFTASNRLKHFPTEKSRAILSRFTSGDEKQDKLSIEAVFEQDFGEVAAVDRTDGLRVNFQNGEILHLRPSGNAPEFRCYNEAATRTRAHEMNRICLAIMESWR
jgi:phosphomannomutase